MEAQAGVGRTFEGDCYKLAVGAGGVAKNMVIGAGGVAKEVAIGFGGFTKDVVKNAWSCKTEATLNGVAVTSLCALGGLFLGSWGAPVGVAACMLARGGQGLGYPAFSVTCGLGFKYLMLPVVLPFSTPAIAAGTAAAILTCAYKGDARVVRETFTALRNLKAAQQPEQGLKLTSEPFETSDE